MNIRKIVSTTIAALLALLTLTSCRSIGEEPGISHIDWENQDLRAEQFVTALTNGDYTIAAAGFNTTMKQALGIRGLKKAWEDTVKEAGDFIAVTATETIPHDEYDIYHVISRHEHKGINSRIVFSSDGLIAGLFFSYVENNDDWNMSTVQKDGYKDIPIIIGDGTAFPLRGVLSMPDNISGKIPAVVIVHGSGPQDMDMTLFANKPYRDIAEYLASNGIAAIRYNKRTLTHGAKVDGNWTVKEETIEDAILATEILKADPRIDENRVYIIGHSLGGMLAPRIHAEGGNYAGLILLAGSPRFLIDISKTQNVLAIEAMQEGVEKQAALASLEQWDEYYSAFLTLPDDTAKNTPVPGWGGVSAYYLKDLFENPISAYLKEITKPFLILQGSNDLQILADVDFVVYQELMAERANVVLKLYDGLNHLFMPSTIETIAELMDEYAKEAKVDSQVLADIAEWINKQ